MIYRSKLTVVFVVGFVASCGSTTNDSGGDAGSLGVDGGGAAGTGANGGDGGVGTDGAAGAAGGTSGNGASGGVGGGTGGTSGTGASGGAGGVGGSAGAGPCSALCGAPGCPACRGPEMIAAPFSGAYAYRIDSTEVTNAHYAEFLAAGVSASAQPGACAKNTTFVPDMSKPIGCTSGKYDPVNRADFPVLCVDWCDARAYCEWAGKRLCMDMDGEETGGKGSDEWVNACTALQTLSYPYGNDYDVAACNGADMALHDAVPVGSLATCEGGLPGLFDMSGNAWEWVGTCDDKPEPSCSALGGGFSIGNAPQLKCGTVAYTFAPWSTSRSDIGFRCCADGIP